jgi:hypothetical protein
MMIRRERWEIFGVGSGGFSVNGNEMQLHDVVRIGHPLKMTAILCGHASTKLWSDERTRSSFAFVRQLFVFLEVICRDLVALSIAIRFFLTAVDDVEGFS